MHFKSLSFIFSCIICSLLLFSGDAYADRPLKSALDLNTEQAAKVAAIQKEARDAMRKSRGDLHRKQRELRRAKAANDSTAIAKQGTDQIRVKICSKLGSGYGKA